MKRNIKLTTLTIGFIFTLLAAFSSLGQTTTHSKTPPTIAPGSATGSFALNDIETVNLYNGGLNFSLPLMKVGGRGSAGYTMTLPIEHRWQINKDTSSPGYTFYRMIYEWWTTAKPGFSPGIVQARQTSLPCDAPLDPAETITNLTFTAVDGTEIELKDTIAYSEPQTGTCPYNYPANGASRGNTFISKDGSHITFVSDTTIYDRIGANPSYAPYILYPSGYLMFKDGTKYRIDNGKVSSISDRNGNKISFSYTANSMTVTDSLNRQITVEYNVNEGGQYGICDKITYLGTNGAARVIRVSKGSLSAALRPGETLKTEEQLFPGIGGNSPPINPSDIVSSVWLPDGRRYQLFYNAYADLAKVILPTGASIEYDWAKISEGSPSFARIYSRVSERRVYPDGVNLEGKTTYQTSTESGNPIVVKQLTPNNVQLSVSKVFFHSGDGAWVLPDLNEPLPWNAGREYKSQAFTADGGNLLTETTQTWYQDNPTWWNQGGNAINNPRVIESTHKLADTNQVSKNSFNYDNFNNVTDTYEYDFGNGAPGAFMRRSHTDYVTDPNYTSHTGAHLRGLPIQTWVSSDINGNNKVSLSQIEYDNYTSDARHAPLVSRSNVVGHDSTNFSAGYPWRGNVTNVSSYGNAASPSQNDVVSVFSQYDMLGNVVKAIDAKGNVSTVSYNDNFGVPDGEARTNSAPGQLNGQQTFAFPTSATNAVGWVTGYSQFDYFTGAGVDSEDINGNVSSVFYNDPLDRPTQSISANNTAQRVQTTIVYDDANRRIQSTSDLFAFGDNLAKSESFYDGLGRTFQSRKYEENGGYVASLTEYDALGRIKRGTNPYRPAQNEPQLWTTTTYDSLSRPVSVTTPDGATVTTAYSGNVVTVTDQAGKQRRSITNGLGQLVRVDEPDDAGNLGSVSAPTQPTSYQYNTIGKMVKVTQGVQARFFLYDSLGRLLRVRQPEQAPNANLNLTDGVTGNSEWTAGFTYDANGNLLTALDAKGVLITSTYDNLNRALTRTYSDGTPTVTYSYDNPNVPFSKGKLTQVQNAVSTSQALAFDNLGRTLASRQITDGVNYDSSYLYNLSGALVEETYPSGRKVKNTFEADGDLSKIETNRPNLGWEIRAQNLGYTASGVLEKLQIGNGLWETAQLNSRLQVTQLGLGTSPTDASIWKLNYDFGTTNNDGNIKSQTLTTPGGTFNQTFVYDSLDRLKQATETSGGNQTWIQNFSYDRYGNRTGFNQTINGQTTNGTPAVDVNTNRFNAGQGYVYDFAGNVVQDPQNRQFIFNGDNKQVQVKDANNNVIGTYFYDGDGKRIKKVSNSDTTTFVYSGGKLVAEYTLTTATPTAPTTQYLGTDMLGSPRILTDQNGQVISRRDFMPFGEDIPNFGARTQANGYKADNLRQKFTGYEKDNETGLDFAEARYYHNAIGRFTAVDPLLASGKSANPQTFNRYVYSLNRPLIMSDPSGMQVGNYVGAVYVTKNGAYTNVSNGNKRYKGKPTIVDAKDGFSYRVTRNSVTLIDRGPSGDLAPQRASSGLPVGSREFINAVAEHGVQKGAVAAAVIGGLGPGIGACIALCGPGAGAVAAATTAAIIGGVAGSNGPASEGPPSSPTPTPSPTPNNVLYHGTDIDSATDIVNNGLNVNNWRASRPEGLLSDKGFSLTTDKATANSWANFNFKVTDCGCSPAVIEANYSDLAPYLRTGDGTQSVDPNELYIDPKDFNKIRSNIFRFSPQRPN